MAHTCSKREMREKVYFIPGTMCTEKLWLPTWKTISNEVRSDFEFVHLPIAEGKPLDSIVRDFGSIICSEPGHVIGFSLGGYIAGKLAIEFYTKIKKLMIVSNSLAALPETEIALRLATLKWLSLNNYSGLATKRILEQIHPESYANHSLVACMKQMDADLGQASLIHQLSVSTERDDIASIVCQKVESLAFVVGDADPLVNTACLNEILACFPQHALSTIASCGHLLPLERPEQFAKLITSWLQKGV